MRFFVYELIDPRCGSVFYVGKGQKGRPWDHAREALRGKRSRKCDRIRAILAEGLDVKVNIVRRFHDEESAYAFEIAHIAEIGLDNLTNVAPGGRGGPISNEPSLSLGELLPKTFVPYLNVIFSMRQCGYGVQLFGTDYTEKTIDFAIGLVENAINVKGLDRVQRHVTSCGGPLLTVWNNAFC